MPEDLSDLVGRRVRELNVSKAELARRSKLSRSYIGNIINRTAPTRTGQYVLSPEAARNLARALEIPESEVAAAMEYLQAESSSTSIDIDKDIKLVLNRRDIAEDDLEEYERAVATAVAIAEQRIAEKEKLRIG